MEAELRDLLAKDAWGQLYAEIRRDSLHHDFTTVEASRPQNRALNRYRDVYPYDHSRVTLRHLPDTDYINASLVEAPRAARSYVLAQGPLPSTVGHFWLAAWQGGSRAVLMLNRVMEKGQLKCHQYWPPDEGDTMTFEDVGLRLENKGSVPGEHYTVRTLLLTHEESGESREVLHFHYTTWPDFGVPQCPDTFLEFLRAVRESGSLEEDAGPPVVHCSAGIGRSGTFCLVDTCLVLIQKEGPDAVKIRDVLLDLRNYRMGLIQTPDQLKFSYLAIAEGAKQAGLISPDILADLPSAADIAAPTDDSDDDGAPPPLPPPRSESLKMQQLLQNILAAQQQSGGNSFHVDPGSGERIPHLLEENNVVNGNGESHSGSGSEHSPADSDGTWRRSPNPLSGAASAAAAGDGDLAAAGKTDSPTKCILNNHKMEERKREMELRRRKKEEANAAMESKIAEMKRKSRESDEWQRRKAAVVERAWPFCVGLAMCAAAGAYYYMKY